MKSKAQSASKRGSVDNYVTKRVAGWNTALRACRFYYSKVRFCKFTLGEDLKINKISITSFLIIK